MRRARDKNTATSRRSARLRALHSDDDDDDDDDDTNAILDDVDAARNRKDVAIVKEYITHGKIRPRKRFRANPATVASSVSLLECATQAGSWRDVPDSAKSELIALLKNVKPNNRQWAQEIDAALPLKGFLDPDTKMLFFALAANGRLNAAPDYFRHRGGVVVDIDDDAFLRRLLANEKDQFDIARALNQGATKLLDDERQWAQLRRVVSLFTNYPPTEWHGSLGTLAAAFVQLVDTRLFKFVELFDDAKKGAPKAVQKKLTGALLCALVRCGSSDAHIESFVNIFGFAIENDAFEEAFNTALDADRSSTAYVIVSTAFLFAGNQAGDDELMHAFSLLDTPDDLGQLIACAWYKADAVVMSKLLELAVSVFPRHAAQFRVPLFYHDNPRNVCELSWQNALDTLVVIARELLHRSPPWQSENAATAVLVPDREAFDAFAATAIAAAGFSDERPLMALLEVLKENATRMPKIHVVRSMVERCVTAAAKNLSTSDTLAIMMNQLKNVTWTLACGLSDQDVTEVLRIAWKAMVAFHTKSKLPEYDDDDDNDDNNDADDDAAVGAIVATQLRLFNGGGVHLRVTDLRLFCVHANALKLVIDMHRDDTLLDDAWFSTVIDRCVSNRSRAPLVYLVSNALSGNAIISPALFSNVADPVGVTWLKNIPEVARYISGSREYFRKPIVQLANWVRTYVAEMPLSEAMDALAGMPLQFRISADKSTHTTERFDGRGVEIQALIMASARRYCAEEKSDQCAGHVNRRPTSDRPVVVVKYVMFPPVAQRMGLGAELLRTLERAGGPLFDYIALDFVHAPLFFVTDTRWGWTDTTRMRHNYVDNRDDQRSMYTWFPYKIGSSGYHTNRISRIWVSPIACAFENMLALSHVVTNAGMDMREVQCLVARVGRRLAAEYAASSTVSASARHRHVVHIDEHGGLLNVRARLAFNISFEFAPQLSSTNGGGEFFHGAAALEEHLVALGNNDAPRPLRVNVLQFYLTDNLASMDVEPSLSGVHNMITSIVLLMLVNLGRQWVRPLTLMSTKKNHSNCRNCEDLARTSFDLGASADPAPLFNVSTLEETKLITWTPQPRPRSYARPDPPNAPEHVRPRPLRVPTVEPPLNALVVRPRPATAAAAVPMRAPLTSNAAFGATANGSVSSVAARGFTFADGSIYNETAEDGVY